ncbi:MAG: IclR family transcriptional regulator [Deferrisomatales bacterium]
MGREDEAPGPAYLVPAVDRALRILELLKTGGRELGVVEIAAATGWNKSTVQKLLVTLLHHGIVERDERTKRFSLGLALAEYGRAALNKFDIRRAARPFLDELVELSGETAVLGLRQGSTLVMIDKREPPAQIRVSPFLGQAHPATATAHGKALLAWLPEPEREGLCRAAGLPARTPRSITDPALFRADLAATRERGYAEEYDEYQEGVSGVAAPVFGPGGQVLATLSVVGPTFRMSPERMREFGLRCVEKAAELGRRVGS